MRTESVRGAGQVQLGAAWPSTLQPGHVTLQFPCASTLEKTSERKALRQTQGRCEGILGDRNSGKRDLFGSLINGIVFLRPMVHTLN
ncbi:hypothetical protein TNIN_312861 [Trichonephila inaurata madagascariensis]|uniref:Uncharacterized protein n=1 Tax=Trichonephila inaurata madagascariensis TaxID=2747483 RepID=A0A8X6YM75_9ARAC|nr:hypothetical protein TNIN_312861 [Trichonephila inaurata madagascariensis]